MSSIGGQKRESQDFTKRVGIFEGDVIAINPSREEYKTKLDREIEEESKVIEYLGEREGVTTLRIDVWLENVKTSFPDVPEKIKVSFFLEDKERENKDGTKKQYINNVGVCSWADDINNLPEWFTKGREVRIAYSGEEDLYNFMRTWLGKLDYRHVETTLELDWKKLMKGNVKDLRDQIDGEWCTSIGALATVVTKEKEGEIKEYQNVYNRAFLPSYSLKHFNLVDYSDDNVIEALLKKKPKDLKPHEKFVLNVTGEYGCKDFYIFKPIKNYDASENFVASDEPMSGTDSSY